MDAATYQRVPAAPYSARPPSPPSIIIPAPAAYNPSDPVVVVPSYHNIDPASLSPEDLNIITGNLRSQVAHDQAGTWNYEDRRTAQSILDYLYLGPGSVARDQKWLRENNITMILAARDKRFAQVQLLAGPARVASKLGIHTEIIDVADNLELIRTFPRVIRLVNDHILQNYRKQNTQHSEDSCKMTLDVNNFQQARILIFCETGNDRSAGIIIAYMMAVFGMKMADACQFVHMRRFCISLDEDMKGILMTYEGILKAEREVHQHQLSAPMAQRPKNARGIEETMGEDDEEMTDVPSQFRLDQDRYKDRAVWQPFTS